MSERVIVHDPDGEDQARASMKRDRPRGTPPRGTLTAAVLMTLISAPIVIAAERSVIEL